MSNFQVAGLASGLDTTALIDSLMYAERATVRRLQSSQNDERGALDAWSDVETRLGAVATSMAAIRNSGALGAATAASNDESVVRVEARAGALKGSYAFQVDTLAAAQQLASGSFASASQLVGAGQALLTGGLAGIGASYQSHSLSDGSYVLDVRSVDQLASTAVVVFDGVKQTVTLGSGGAFVVTAADGGTASLGSNSLKVGKANMTVFTADETTTAARLVAGINVSGGPVRAQLIDTGDGSATPVRLLLTAAATGVAAAADIDFGTMNLFAGGLTELRAATDASITFGSGGLTVTRPTNTISDMFSGLTLDLVGMTQGTEVQITVNADLDAQTKSVTTVIDGVSATLRQLAKYSSWDVEGGKGGVLVGDFTGRAVIREIEQAMGTVVNSSSFKLLSQIGVSFQRDGSYKIDQVKLRDALATDPDGVAGILLGDPTRDDDGVLDVLANTIDHLDDKGGRIATAKESRERSISELDRLIELQEVRLTNVEARYQRQFASLETMLSQLQSQGNYLSSLLGTPAQ